MVMTIKVKATDEDKEERKVWGGSKKRQQKKSVVKKNGCPFLEVSCSSFFPPCLYTITKTYYHNHRIITTIKSIQSPSTVLQVLWDKHQYLCVQGEPCMLLH